MRKVRNTMYHTNACMVAKNATTKMRKAGNMWITRTSRRMRTVRQKLSNLNNDRLPCRIRSSGSRTYNCKLVNITTHKSNKLALSQK